MASSGVPATRPQKYDLSQKRQKRIILLQITQPGKSSGRFAQAAALRPFFHAPHLIGMAQLRPYRVLP
jgi:hypothetical protein